ncbi:MAG: glutathione S-transferase N-terminal domain-containing protein [Roseibium sp.]|uniref:glutathione binding-like protein n=1 Tax=Roseibium sp. TaxID=1936156 RepID=UPI00261CB2B0|nr:glutathione binding-like protein [Roseibium sp.]MCV0428661.1 glutathione S-transferase N-terminal domain-containing protein [Roseibium sp.]
MKLFYKPGACSMAAHILLNETGTAYQLEKVDTDNGTTETGAAFAATNPRGYVPALKFDDGQILTENVAILHWIGETFPTLAPELADEPLQRFRQLELLSFLSSELHKAFSPYFSGKTFSETEQTANLDRLKAKITQFDRLLAQGGSFLLGARFSVVDAYAFVILNWANFIGVSLADWPDTAAFVARINARPSTQKTLKEEGLAA